jgi:Meiotically up-regulated gene 113
VSFVYIMRNGVTNVVKIGRARNVESRRGQFMTGNPEELTLIDSIETDEPGRCETFLHRIFESKRVRGEFFALTPIEAQDAARRAREYVADHLPAEHEAKRLAQTDCDGPARPPDDRERGLHRELLEARESRSRWKFECDRLENELKARIGTSEGIEGIASWTTHTKTTFDEASFRKEHPELHAAFSRPVRLRRFVLLWS